MGQAEYCHQVLFVIIFWTWRVVRGNAGFPRVLWLKKLNKLLKHFTSYQIVLTTLTTVYALRNLDIIFGLGAPEPLARLYSPSFYRATWIITGLDAGFATAISIRPKWLRDICSLIFSVYYIIYANSADERLRRYRAVPTVEMLRATWEKTTNPYLRRLIYLPPVSTRRKIFIPRPKSSSYTRPITAYLFFSLPEDKLCNTTELILDFPGGGFVAMSPEHHEERLRICANVTRRPVLSIDYGKAPEYPYPFAIDEAYDTYKAIADSAGRCIGMSGKSLRIIISGDSAGATLAINTVNQVLEHRNRPGLLCEDAKMQLPVALVLNYAALDFNFTSWMSAENLRVLRSEQSSGNLPGLAELASQKNHLQHVSPLSMVCDQKPRGNQLQRRKSWRGAFRALAAGTEWNREQLDETASTLRYRHSTGVLKTLMQQGSRNTFSEYSLENGGLADAESDEDFRQWKEEDRPIQARVLYPYTPSMPTARNSKSEEVGEHSAAQTSPRTAHKLEVCQTGGTIGTRLTMTSRTGYFQDRIISPSMMRAMAIMYIGPHQDPDFRTDYRISPILTPSHLLAQYPPLLMQCGERDPFVDDTVIFAGRIKEAKRARKIELELMISGKSARFGEGLRMSRNESLDVKAFAALKKELEKLASESEEDWVQVDLFSDWSHGYLQMGALMTEARVAIRELGEWIDDTFSRLVQTSTYNGHVLAQGCPVTPSSLVPAPETEADEQDGITFVAKKYQDELRRSSFEKATREHEGLSNSDRTLLDDGIVAGRDKKQWCLENSSTRQAKQELGQSLEGHKPATPRQAGQTISEMELMRRRRLLDSHIFEPEL
ncbi:hypothetical protein AX15_003688 [Amanita polypyramis BW_CC]|nr:hypothetical protein AX15_003688 [Amanita polypyramis BW_CC]